MFTNYTEAELNLLISNKVEENLHLDYKDARSLYEIDGKSNESRKVEISKDVASFANSDGGTIIYWIEEKGHLPVRISPINRRNISRERLEQIINGNINPILPSYKITPISIWSDINNVVYVVEIEKSKIAHQAKDNIYYKRQNFTTIKMDGYEVQDVMNRQISPSIELVKNDENLKYEDNLLYIPIKIRNKSIKVLEKVCIVIEFIDINQDNIHNVNSFLSEGEKNNWRLIYKSIDNNNRYYTWVNSRIGEFTIKYNQKQEKISYKTTLLADMMEPHTFKSEIIIKDYKPIYVTHEKL